MCLAKGGHFGVDANGNLRARTQIHSPFLCAKWLSCFAAAHCASVSMAAVGSPVKRVCPLRAGRGKVSPRRYIRCAPMPTEPSPSVKIYVHFHRKA